MKSLRGFQHITWGIVLKKILARNYKGAVGGGLPDEALRASIVLFSPNINLDEDVHALDELLHLSSH